MLSAFITDNTWDYEAYLLDNILHIHELSNVSEEQI